ncbi:Hsp33 family molecular chaperone HslO [Pleionea sp. CnH1-48]|uniref:Hsp33 family molecular chaperone HslO n=1 Tax=Pleionea sp. CnH1-48 TaxID=2954494 RepID=UPI0020978F7E|nr:Hsp33 family molecular chaperone HslO [Pleionea sp. CnH1-48]MCO7225207.1 Hsp33 family molecular chaperone HslO [Pleionea sp. CnH1-48]
MNQTNLSLRFLFEDLAVRGQIVQLSTTLTDMLKHHQYPESAQKQLIEATLATALLTETIKFEGKLSLQAQSSGPLSLFLVQSTHDQKFRGVVRCEDDTPITDDLKQLMPGAQMAITIEPSSGSRYQGIVPMHQHTLAGCLEDYFKQSEQLPTQIYLFTDGVSAGTGLLLQAMPDADNEADFEHVSYLAQTLKAEEALSLDMETILHRLYHQDKIRVFEPQPVTYECGCSRERSLYSLTVMSKEELLEIIKEEGKLTTACEFCNSQYEFDVIDVEQVFANAGHDQSDSTRH